MRYVELIDSMTFPCRFGQDTFVVRSVLRRPLLTLGEYIRHEIWICSMFLIQVIKQSEDIRIGCAISQYMSIVEP